MARWLEACSICRIGHLVTTRAILAATIIVAACGGGEGPDASPTTAQPSISSPTSTDVATTPYVIDYYGDSTIWGQDPAGTGIQLTSNPPAVLQSELTSRCGFPVMVRNFGVPSSRIGDALEGNNAFYAQPFADAIKVSTARLVIANYGINDARLQTSIATYGVNMRAMGQIVIASGKTFVYETPNPVVDGFQPAIWAGENAYLGRQIDSGVAAAAELGAPVVSQYAYFMSLGNLLAYFPDGVHPNSTTIATKVIRVADVLKPIVCP